MVSIPKQSGFVVVGAASGQIFASQVGTIGLVGSFGGIALGTPVIVVSGILAGAAIQGIIEGIENGDVAVLGVTTVGSVLGAGCAAAIGNVGVGVAGTAFGIGVGTMAVAGGVFALGVYQLIQIFGKDSQAESYEEIFSRMQDKISDREFYIEALLELDSLSRDLKWHKSFSDLEIDEELRQLKQTLGINHITESPGKYDWETLESQEKLNQLKEQLEELFRNNQFQENSFYSYPPTSENNNQIITINLSRSVWQSKILKTIENNDFSSLTITSDSKYLFAGNVNGTIFQWDLTTCQHLFTFTSGRSEIMATEVSPDQKRLLAAGFDRRISEWNIQSKGIFIGFHDLPSSYSHDGVIYSLSCSPDGKIIASSGSDAIIKIWNGITGHWNRNLIGHTACVRAIIFSANSQSLISASEDKTIRLWQVNSWGNSSILGEHPTIVIGLDLLKDEQLLISASFDGTVKIWDLDRKSCLKSFQTNQKRLLDISVNPITKIIATASTTEVKLWDWKTQQCLQTLDGCCFPIQFSPNGQLLVTCNPLPRQGLKVWYLQTDQSNVNQFDDFGFDLLLEWWEVLGVSFDADQKTVKAAYYSLAKKYHPDQNKQNAYAVAMQKINHAYDKFCSQQETL